MPGIWYTSCPAVGGRGGGVGREKGVVGDVARRSASEQLRL